MSTAGITAPRYPEASFSGGGSWANLLSISSVDVTFTVNQMPTIAVVPIPRNSKIAVRVGGKDVSDYYGRLQEAKHSNSTQGDTTLTLTDGNGGQISVPMIFLAPTNNLSAGAYSVDMSFVGYVTRIDSLRTDIYNSLEFAKYLGQGVNSTDGSKSDKTVSELLGQAKSIPECILIILDEMIRMWVGTTQGGNKNVTYRAEDAQMIKFIHSNNTIPLRIFRDILSTADFRAKSKASDKLFAANQDIKRPFLHNILALVADILRAQGGGFVSVFNRLMSAFDLNFVPTDIYPYVRVVSFDDMILNESPREITVSPLDFSPRLGRSSLMPFKACTVRGAMTAGYRPPLGQSLQTLEGAGQILALWPPDALSANTGGYTKDTSIPAWIPQGQPASALAEKFIKQSLKGDVVSHSELIADDMAAAANIGALYSSILQETARLRYVDAALQDDSVIMRVPLSFDWSVGERYKISTVEPGKGAVQLFEGTLVAYRIVIEKPEGPGGQGRADTTLSFSHVEMSGFTLPYKTR